MQPHILKAIQKAREEFEKMYDGICTITQKGKSVDPITHKTTYRDSVVYENEPCRLSEKKCCCHITRYSRWRDQRDGFVYCTRA